MLIKFSRGEVNDGIICYHYSSCQASDFGLDDRLKTSCDQILEKGCYCEIQIVKEILNSVKLDSDIRSYFSIVWKLSNFVKTRFMEYEEFLRFVPSYDYYRNAKSRIVDKDCGLINTIDTRITRFDSKGAQRISFPGNLQSGLFPSTSKNKTRSHLGIEENRKRPLRSRKQ